MQCYNFVVFRADVLCKGADYAGTEKPVPKAVGSWLLPEGDSRYWQLDRCVPVCIEIFHFSFCSHCANHLQLSYRLQWLHSAGQIALLLSADVSECDFALSPACPCYKALLGC